MPIEYLLPCPCGRQIPVQAVQAGQELQCTCGATLEVPTMRGLAELERAEPKSAASPARQARRPTTAPPSALAWGKRQRRLFIGAVMTALGLGLLVYLYMTQPTLPEVEQLSPLGTWQLWRELRHGLEWRPAWEEAYLEDVADNHRWMVVAGAIAVLGVLTMSSSLLVARRPVRRRAKKAPPRRRPARHKPPA